MYPFFSIIIPIHNPNICYLKQCLESIAHQLHDKDEIICILNGNQNNKALEEVISSSCVNIISNIPDVSSARNIGIKNAKNDFIIFMDCDDVVGASLLDKARLLASNYNADYITFLDTSDYLDLNKDYEKTNTYSKDDFLKIWQDDDCLLSTHFQYRSCWNHIYKKELIIDKNILFTENQTIAEDTLFNLCYTLNSNSFVVDNSVMYFHRPNEQGISVKYNSNAVNSINNLISLYKSVLISNNVNNVLFFRHLYKEILFNYIPYIFKSYIFNKKANLNIFNRRYLVKQLTKNKDIKTAIQKIKIKEIKNKKHRAFLILLKCKMYLMISAVYKKSPNN